MGIRLVVARSDIGARSIRLSTDGSDRWQFDGQVSPRARRMPRARPGVVVGFGQTLPAHRMVLHHPGRPLRRPCTTEAMPRPQTQSTLETHAFAAVCAPHAIAAMRA
jgi:hypothetical protein